MDRDEILALISKMDDVTDSIEAAAQRLGLFDIRTVPPKLVEMARVLNRV
jgi:uncharacterized protein Yka (UPF0111/DUF47 family)